MRWHLKRTVALVGMMGAGKTAVGTALARNLGVPFLDSDAEIVKAANREIAEIFERDGEPFFREKESQVITRLLAAPRKSILSTGGGAYLREGNREAISRDGVAVWLKVPVEVLWSRVRSKNTRPLLRTENPRATLEQLAQAREPFYAQAELTVEASAETTVEDMAARVIAALEARPDVLSRR